MSVKLTTSICRTCGTPFRYKKSPSKKRRSFHSRACYLAFASHACNNPMFGKRHTRKIKTQQSVRQRRQWRDPSYQEKWSATRKAMWSNPSVRERRLRALRSTKRCLKISMALKGRPQPPYVVEKMTATKRTKAFRKKFSAIITSLWKSKAYRNTQQVARVCSARSLAGTSIERPVISVLCSLGVAFQFQPLLGLPFIPDFYLPKFNRVVECDSYYWHRRTRTQRRKDWRRTNLMRRLGYRVSRLGEKTLLNRDRLHKHFVRILK